MNNQAGNNLIGKIPPEISGLRSIETLLLSENCIFGTLPNEVSKLSTLVDIDIGWNYLSGTVPADLYKMKSLTYINMASNKKEGTCNRTNGDDIEVFSNGLEGNLLGPNIGKFVNLKELKVYGNKLNGSISSEIGKLIHLGEPRLS